MNNIGKKKEKRVGKRAALHAHIKGHKGTFAVYLVLRLFVTFLAIWSLIGGNYENFFLCIFAAEILGEISSFYVRISFWDTMLHTINGFLCAAIGFALVDILNRSTRFRFQLSPLFLAVVAFCFSMTVGVVWEFFEFFMDQVFLLDMQKDFVVNTVSSAMLSPIDSAAPDIIRDIVDTVIITADGTQYHLSDFGIHGYLDIGIIDTMKDLIVNFIGAFVFSVIGFFYVKSRGRGRFAQRFIPTLREKKVVAQQQEKEEKEN